MGIYQQLNSSNIIRCLGVVFQSMNQDYHLNWTILWDWQRSETWSQTSRKRLPSRTIVL